MSAEVVIDVGCTEWGADTSVDKLVDRFQPRVLFGFDPQGGEGSRRQGYTIDGCRVEIHHVAAWTSAGTIPMWGGKLRATTVEHFASGDPRMVDAIDLGRFILDLAEPVIVKLDVEGAEYRLLGHLIACDAIRHVERLLVEWHRDTEVEILGKERAVLERVLGQMGVEVEEWA